jgi:hypothetical protein
MTPNVPMVRYLKSLRCTSLSRSLTTERHKKMPRPRQYQTALHNKRRSVKNGGEDAPYVNFDQPHVALPHVGMTHGLCAELCSVIVFNDRVTSLDLSHNNLGDDGAEVLAKLMSQKKNVLALNVSHNGITDAGVVLLMRAARKHVLLQSLNIASNAVGDASVLEITRLVEMSDCITELVLIDTQVSVRGALALAQAMINNESLMYVSLPFTLGCDVLNEIQCILTRNWGRLHKVDEQLGAASVMAGLAQHRADRQQLQWKSAQPRAEPTSSRVLTVNAPLADWADASVRPALLYLSLLDRNQQPSSPRGSRRESPRYEVRGSARSSLASSRASVNLPPIPSSMASSIASIASSRRSTRRGPAM